MRDWESILQESKGLLVAICISLLLHLVIIGQSHFVLPKLGDDHFLITAQLVTPKPAPAKTKSNVVKEKAKPPAETQSPEPQKPEPQEAVQAPTNIEPESVAPEPFPAEPVMQNEPVAEQPDTSESAVDETGLIVNSNPYEYVETEFDVRTNINAKVDSSPDGRARIIYQRVRNGEQYKLRSLIEARGLAALVIPDLLQTSEGFLSKKGLQPQHYLYQFGSKQDKTFKADFDWESNKLSMHGSKGDKQVGLIEGAQDLLSFMYQFMFVAPLQTTQLAITNGKKLDTYDYSFEGEEIIQTKMGDIKTVHLLRTSGDDGKDELWLALDYQYVPVKIRKTEKENKVYELLATSLKTEKPPI